MARVCTEIVPFTVELAHFNLFAHGRRGATLYLAPEPTAPLVALQTHLRQALPAYDDTRRQGGFTPHVSVGQSSTAQKARAALVSLATNWQPMSFTANAVQLILRNQPPHDVFHVDHNLSFGARGAKTRVGSFAADGVDSDDIKCRRFNHSSPFGELLVH